MKTPYMPQGFRRGPLVDFRRVIAASWYARNPTWTRPRPTVPGRVDLALASRAVRVAQFNRVVTQ